MDAYKQRRDSANAEPPRLTVVREAASKPVASPSHLASPKRYTPRGSEPATKARKASPDKSDSIPPTTALLSGAEQHHARNDAQDHKRTQNHHRRNLLRGQDMTTDNRQRPDQELTAFGKTIRETREAQAMTPAELATAANVEREDLEALEAGRLAPADLLQALSAALGADPAARGGYLDTAAVLAAFGRRVRERREKHGLSQDALGRLAGGMNRVTVYKLEAGLADPRLTTIRRLARGLQVPPRELIERAKCHARRLTGPPSIIPCPRSQSSRLMGPQNGPQGALCGPSASQSPPSIHETP